MASYYFWKWAENDLPGRPVEVQADLLRGQMHPALQPFDPRRLLTALRKLAARHRDEEWHWEAVPAGGGAQTRFVFVTCPPFDDTEARARQFIRTFSRLGLSGYDEQKGWVIQGLSPKINVFINGQLPRERAYDITEDDLPSLLRRIDPKRSDPFGILDNRHHHFVQCWAEGRRFTVEWARNEYLPKTIWDQWRAQDAQRLDALGGVYGGEELPPSKDPDLLRYADTLRIFQAFVRDEPRPTRYPWRNINHLLE